MRKNEEHEQLLTALSGLQQWIAELETSETERQQAEQVLQEAEERLEREIAGRQQAEAALAAERQLLEDFDAQRRIATRQTALYRVLRAVTGQSDPIYVAVKPGKTTTSGGARMLIAAKALHQTVTVRTLVKKAGKHRGLQPLAACLAYASRRDKSAPPRFK